MDGQKKMRKKIIAFAAMAALCCWPLGVNAQSQQQQQQQQSPPATVPVQPIPPLAPANNSNDSGAVPTARGVSSPDAGASDNSAQAAPDTHALSGAEYFTVGSLGKTHNIFDPSFSFSEFGDTGIQTAQGQTQLASETIVGGSLSLAHSWNHYTFTMAYNGGATFYPTAGSQYNYSFNDLSVSQSMTWQRWKVLLRDDLQASPQAAFGGEGMGGPGQLGLGGGGNGVLGVLVPSNVPGQTIQTGQAMRLMNTSVGELDYAFTRRTSITFSGSYGLLHFIDPGYVDSRQLYGQVGLNYLMDSKNSIGLMAGYGLSTFPGTNQKSETENVQVSYGRKVTGRLALQLSAGPQRNRLYNFVGNAGPQWGWTLQSSLTYARPRTSYTLSYGHMISSGSGVFYASTTDTVSASMRHQLTRDWGATLNSGYSKSENLVPSATAANSFNTWYAGANLGRPLGRHVTFGLSYGAFGQTNAAGVCPVANCGIAAVRHNFGVNLAWHLGRIEFE